MKNLRKKKKILSKKDILNLYYPCLPADILFLAQQASKLPTLRLKQLEMNDAPLQQMSLMLAMESRIPR